MKHLKALKLTSQAKMAVEEKKLSEIKAGGPTTDIKTLCYACEMQVVPKIEFAVGQLNDTRCITV